MFTRDGTGAGAGAEAGAGAGAAIYGVPGDRSAAAAAQGQAMSAVRPSSGPLPAGRAEPPAAAVVRSLSPRAAGRAGPGSAGHRTAGRLKARKGEHSTGTARSYCQARHATPRRTDRPACSQHTAPGPPDIYSSTGEERTILDRISI